MIEEFKVSDEVKKALKDKKTLLGSKSTMKAAKNGKIKTIVYAKNVPKNTLADVKSFEGKSSFDIKEFSGNSLDLGELCGKPFGVLLLGIKK